MSVLQTRRNPFTGQLVEAIVLPELPDGDPASIALTLGPASAADEGCRFGGNARLPEGVAWPEGPKGPLSLVGQLDFASLAAAHPGALPLPERGVLSFFYDIDEQPWGFELAHAQYWKLVYVEDPRSAVLHEPKGTVIRPRALAPSKSASRSAPLHKVGGVPDWVQNDTRALLALQLSGAGLNGSLDAVRAAEARGVDVGALAAGGAKWRLLWQIDTDDDAGLRWGDTGMLYVLIEESDLARRNFDRAWALLQCL